MAYLCRNIYGRDFMSNEPLNFSANAPSRYSSNSLTPERGFFSPTLKTHPPLLGAYRISAHAATWRYKMEGTPKREPDKTNVMRGWIARYWRFQNCTIQACKKTLFISVKTGKRLSTRQAIYGAWNKQDRARRAFSEWQQIGLSPEETAHPSGARGAHIVIETPELKAPLNTQAFKPESARIGLIADASHDFKPELTGIESIEGGIGADWLFLKYPAEFRALREEMKAQLGLMEGENRALAQAVQMLIKRGWRP